MARRQSEFRPDPTGFDWVSKLLLTPKQRKSVLKWLLYSLVCVAGLVLQDSMLARVRFLGGGFELAPALIILICVLEGCENGSVFALTASMIYVFSGSAQDRYCIGCPMLSCGHCWRRCWLPPSDRARCAGAPGRI